MVKKVVQPNIYIFFNFTARVANCLLYDDEFDSAFTFLLANSILALQTPWPEYQLQLWNLWKLHVPRTKSLSATLCGIFYLSIRSPPVVALKGIPPAGSIASFPNVFPAQEWRHAHGMRCLGIPNTAHFANVTQIEDAVSRKSRITWQSQPCFNVGFSKCSQRFLDWFSQYICCHNLFFSLPSTLVWAKLKSQKALERWQPDTEVREHLSRALPKKRQGLFLCFFLRDHSRPAIHFSAPRDVRKLSPPQKTKNDIEPGLQRLVGKTGWWAAWEGGESLLDNFSLDSKIQIKHWRITAFLFKH